MGRELRTTYNRRNGLNRKSRNEKKIRHRNSLRHSLYLMSTLPHLDKYATFSSRYDPPRVNYEGIILSLQIMFSKDMLREKELPPLTNMYGELLPTMEIVRALYDPEIMKLAESLNYKNGYFMTRWGTMRYSRVRKKANRVKSSNKLPDSYYVRDMGKSILLNGDIIITDPCYFLNEGVDELSRANIRGLESTTVYGDWSCTTFGMGKRYKRRRSEILGHFCADGGMVAVALLSDVLKHNPSFDYHINRKWTITLIKNFHGTVSIKYFPKTDSVRIIGVGNKNFITSQTGF